MGILFHTAFVFASGIIPYATSLGWGLWPNILSKLAAMALASSDNSSSSPAPPSPSPSGSLEAEEEGTRPGMERR
jgi:hypothetical protein